MEPPNVLSFDQTRVKFIGYRIDPISVEKMTPEIEYRQIVDASEYLARHPIFLKDGTISVLPAPILSWREKSSILVTQYCKGTNFEHILRSTINREERLKWVMIFKEFFQKLRLRAFLWGDCAPRNMIFNKDSQSIRIVDFERKLVLGDEPVKLAVFSRYIRNYSLEEFSCLLFKGEQKILFSEVLTEEPKKSVPISEISSKRKKKLLELTFGRKKHYSIMELQSTEKFMAFIATPFFIDGMPYYPMDVIDKISSNGGANAYAMIVEKLKGANNKEKYYELEKAAKTFR